VPYAIDRIANSLLLGVPTATRAAASPARSNAETTARNLRTVRHLIKAEGLGVVEAARTVGRSNPANYRHRAADITLQ
jgi:hypothetical protein